MEGGYRVSPIVYVGGTFDLFHAGHVNFLRHAAAFGRVTVSLNTDEFAAEYKRPPVLTLTERTTVVEACRYVEAVVVNTGGANSRPAIEHVGPRYIAHGDDWESESLMKQMGVSDAWLAQRRISFLYVRYTAGISSSDIIERIKCASQ